MFSNQDNSVSSIFQQIKKILKKNSIENYSLEAQWILEKITHQNKSQLYKNFTQKINRKQFSLLEKIIRQRIQGYPFAYCLRETAFWKEFFFVEPPVLIPRKESELLVAEILDLLKENNSLLEIGCGSGVLSLSLAMEKKLQIVAIDSSAKAITLSKKNQQKHIFKVLSPVEFLEYKIENYLTKNQKKYHLIFSNPPYIGENEKNEVSSLESLKFEDKNALFAKNNGYYFYDFFAKNLKKHLLTRGFLVLEHGWKQKNQIIEIFQQEGWNFYKAKKDYSGKDRILIFRL